MYWSMKLGRDLQRGAHRCRSGPLRCPSGSDLWIRHRARSDSRTALAYSRRLRRRSGTRPDWVRCFRCRSWFQRRDGNAAADSLSADELPAGGIRTTAKLADNLFGKPRRFARVEIHPQGRPPALPRSTWQPTPVLINERTPLGAALQAAAMPVSLRLSARWRVRVPEVPIVPGLADMRRPPPAT
jgi:hypothetical protein